MAKFGPSAARVRLALDKNIFQVHDVDVKDEVVVARSCGAARRPTRIGRTFGEDRYGQGRYRLRGGVQLAVRRQGRRDRSAAEVMQTGDGRKSAAKGTVAKTSLKFACSTAEHCHILHAHGIGSPLKRPRADGPYGGAASSVGTIPIERHPKGVRMDRLPNSLTIALWVVGSCWALAVIAYAIGASRELILPLVVLGILTGTAEWVIRRRGK